MDVSQLFRAGVTVDGAPMPAATSTIYGTAVADSHDGTVLVEMDGDAVTQPAQESTTATLPASAFEGGTAALPSEPFPGSVRVYAEQADDDHLLDEEAYQVNGDRLTIEALAGGEPVGVEWATHVAQVFANEDFAGGAVQLEGEPANLSVTEDVGGASTPDWQPVAYELDGTTLTVAGMEPADGRVVATYVRTVEIVTDAGEQVLPDMPAADDVAVFGRTTDAVNPPVEAVVTGWDLAGDLITIPAGYDAYTVIYTMDEAEEWNLSGQTDDEPLPDYDPGWDGGAQDADELEPEAVTVGHVLTYEPDAGTLAVTVDGVAAAYTLDVQTVTVTATPAPERVLAVEYDAAQTMELPAAAFANGPVELPSVPNAGTVAVEVGGAPLDPSAFSVDDRALAIPGLVAGVSAYVVEYAEQLPVAAVELPTFPAVHEGDTVQITVVGGVPTVTAVQGAGDSVQATLEDATTLAVDASTAADAAEQAATEAAEIAAAVGQHVWNDTDGQHVTEAEKDAFLQTPSGRNILMNALGILLRDALVNLVQLSRSGMSIYDGQGNAASNVVAQFTQNLISLSPQADSATDTASIELFDGQGLIECIFGQTRSRLNLSAGSVWAMGYDSASLETTGGLGETHLTLAKQTAEMVLRDLYGAAKTWSIDADTGIIHGPSSAIDIDRTLDFHVTPANGATYDCRIIAATDGTNLSFMVRDPANVNEVTQFYMQGGAAANKGRIMQRTSTDGGSTWSTQHGVRSPWTSLGTATNTGSITIDLSSYEELCIAAKANGKLVTATIPKALLTTTEQEVWLGGGKSTSATANAGNLRAVVNVTTTKITGVNFSEGSTNRTSSTTWYAYAR